MPEARKHIGHPHHRPTGRVWTTAGEASRSGWVICDDCGVRLARPDGAPVALPDGGRLGPDPSRLVEDIGD